MTYAVPRELGLALTTELAALDRRLAELFREYFSTHELDTTALRDLEDSESKLRRIVPSLSGDARPHFAMASSIACWMLEEIHEAPTTQVVG